MKTINSYFVVLATLAFISSCKKDKTFDGSQTQVIISSEILAKIQSHGFGISNVVPYENGYVVEGDILLTPDFLDTEPVTKHLIVAKEEQYHTTVLVTTPRVVKILVSSTLSNAFFQATDLAIARYNNLGLNISFIRVTSGPADITVTGSSTPPTGSSIQFAVSGFPNAGNPYSNIQVNTHRLALGTNPNATFAGSVIQHEIGHCIGFRHTDYQNRSYSCGGTAVNEGLGTAGAVWISGTPVGPDPNSWMLACQTANTDRTFNANDVVALKALYLQ